MSGDSDPNLDAVARRLCARLLSSNAAKRLTPAQAEGLVIIAFAVGAAWALNLPDIVAYIEAQMRARGEPTCEQT